MYEKKRPSRWLPKMGLAPLHTFAFLSGFLASLKIFFSFRLKTNFLCKFVLKLDFVVPEKITKYLFNITSGIMKLKVPSRSILLSKILSSWKISLNMKEYKLNSQLYFFILHECLLDIITLKTLETLKHWKNWKLFRTKILATNRSSIFLSSVLRPHSWKTVRGAGLGHRRLFRAHYRHNHFMLFSYWTSTTQIVCCLTRN